MDILMVHDGNWLLIIIFIFRMGNPLLRESLLGILLFFWEVLKQIQVRAWFLLPAVSNQNLELFHILGWWTQRKQLFVWGLLEYKDLDTYRVDRNDGLPRDLEPKMVINLWYILCIFVYAYIYIHICVRVDDVKELAILLYMTGWCFQTGSMFNPTGSWSPAKKYREKVTDELCDRGVKVNDSSLWGWLLQFSAEVGTSVVHNPTEKTSEMIRSCCQWSFIR